MKKIILVLFLSIVGLNSYSQIPSTQNDAEKWLLKKSDRQKKKVPVFIALGAIAIAAGIPMYTSSTNLDDAVSGIGLSMWGGMFVITGGLLFRSSARNKKRAITIDVAKQTINRQSQPNNYARTQTAIVLRFNLSK